MIRLRGSFGNLNNPRISRLIEIPFISDHDVSILRIVDDTGVSISITCNAVQRAVGLLLRVQRSNNCTFMSFIVVLFYLAYR